MFRSNFSLNFAWALGLSALMPITIAPRFSISSLASRNPQASRIQPGVLALGKKNSTTLFLPAYSLRLTVLPRSSGSEKPGALLPSCSIHPPLLTSLGAHASCVLGVRHPRTLEACAPRDVRRLGCGRVAPCFNIPESGTPLFLQ